MAFIDITQLYRVLSSALLCITVACTSSIKQVCSLLAVSAVTKIPSSKSYIDQKPTNLLFCARQTVEGMMIYCGEVCKMAEILEKFHEALAEKKGACSLSKVTFLCDVASQLVQRRREVSYDFAINLAQEQNKHLLHSMTTSGNKQLITGQRSTTLLMPRSDRCNLCRKIGLKSE